MQSRDETFVYVRWGGRWRLAHLFASLLVVLGLAACGEPEWEPHTLHRTTSGKLALANLNSQIKYWQDSGTADADDPLQHERRARLVYALTQRAQLRLSSADFSRALAISSRWVKRSPDDHRAWLAQAHSAGALHQFELAAKSLDRAEALSAPADRVAAARCSLHLTAGRYEQAESCARQRARQSPSSASLGFLASVLGDLARYDEAAEAYAQAWRLYQDPSPFMPAWLALGESKMWAAAGKPERAESILAFMRERLPQHIGIQVEHAVALEALGQGEAAMGQMESLLTETDDPDVPNLLAIWLNEAGDMERSEALAEQAAKGYAQRMASHPQAYAAHAIEYWLSPGDDAAKALELARFNVQPGPTVGALALLVHAADAAGEAGQVCQAADRFFATGKQREAADRKGSMAAEIDAIRKESSC